MSTTGGALLLLAGGAWLASKPKRGDADAASSVAITKDVRIKPPFAARALIPLPPAREGLLAIAHDPTVLMQATGCKGLVTQIRDNLGLPDTDFTKLVLSAIDAFALYVQMLPASESHHHANPGGLLIHLLESACHASKIGQSYKLPRGAATEEQHKFKAHWAVGITLSALLHDVGKPISNLDLKLHDARGELGNWDGLSGAMTQYAKATHYSVKFGYAEYEAHTRLPVILMQSLVGHETRQWLEQAPGLIPAMMTYLDGKAPDNDAIKEIVTLADQHSVRQNLLTGPKTQFASARAVPAITRMLAGLRGAIADEEMALNRPGAGGFVDADGEHIYFVAGVVIDAARKWLDTNETRHHGAAGLPKDNTRWFDTFQEHGALVTHPSGGSIWPLHVAVAKPDGTVWEQRLTTLKFATKDVFAHNNLPRPLQGTLTPDLASKTPAAKLVDVASPVIVTTLEALPVQQTRNTRQLEEKGFNAGRAIFEAMPAPVSFVDPFIDSLAGQAHKTAPQLVTTGNAQDDYAAMEAMFGFAMPIESLAVSVSEGAGTGMTSPAETPTTPATASQIQAQTASYTEEDNDNAEFLSTSMSAKFDAMPAMRNVLAAPPVRPADEFTGLGTASMGLDESVNHFLAWLQNGLSRGDIQYNQSTGMAHMVPEGLALLSPMVYIEFIRQNPHLHALFEPTDDERSKSTKKTDKALHRVIQRRLENSGLLRINTSKSKLHTYSARAGEGNKMTMIIIGRPQQFIHPLPPENNRITRLSPPLAPMP